MKPFSHSAKKSILTIGFKSAAFFILLFGLLSNPAKACSPLNVPTLVTWTISGTNLNLNWSSNTTYNCTYSVQVELLCNSAAFTGLAPFYITAGINKTSTPYAYPMQSINISSLCPGSVYKFRAREVYGTGTFSGWTTTYTFTTPGSFIAPTLTITSSASSICPPQTTQLTASVTNGCGSPPFTYSWTPATGLSCTTCSNPIASPAVTTTYSCTVSDTKLGCWSVTSAITVVVSTIPPTVGVITATPTTMCSGNSATLSMSTYSGSLQWQSGPSSSGPWTNIAGATASMIVTPTLAANTCYQALVTGCGSTLTSNNVCITVNPSPTVTVNSPSICAGQTANLTANGAASYVWSAGATSTGPNTADASPMTTTSYTVTGTTAGCTGTAVATVSVNPLPVPTSTNNSPVCTGGIINIGSSGGGTYSWTGPASFSSTLQNPNITPAALTHSGMYIVTVNLAGCTATAQTNVTVFTPTATAANTGPYCAGATVQLSSSAGAGYTWSGPGFSSSVQNPNIPNAQATASGVYTVVINLGSCTANATTSVTVNALPTPLASNNTPICIQNPINFTGGGGTNYVWAGPGFSSTQQSPTIPVSAMTHNGTYTLTVTDANNCTNTITTLVTINAQPIVSASGATVCQTANTGIISSGGTTYSWTGPGGYTSSLQNPTFPNAVPANSGVYTVLITDANTCTNTAVANLLVHPSPVPNITTNSPICIDHVLSLNGTGGIIYSWSGPNGFFSSAQSPTIMANTTGYTGTYGLTVTDANGCTASTTASAVVNPIPNINITADKINACPPLCSQFSFNSTSAVQSFEWSLGNGVSGTGNTAQTCYNTQGTYTINAVVNDIYGCNNSTTFTVEVYPKPIADFNFAPIKPIEMIEEVTFTDASHNAVIATWNWYFMNTAQYTSVQQNPTFMYEHAGEYPVALIVKSDKGCLDTIIQKIVVGEDYGIYVPNAFTPNADGFNDVFQPKGFGIVKYELNIFDRWGEKVFHTKVFEEGWNGTFQGRNNKIIEEGTYTWLINLTNVYGKSHELKGHVTLIR